MLIAALFKIAKNRKPPQMSINWWRNKQNVVCPNDGIQCSNKKEWDTKICYNMNEPQKHYAKWKMLDAEDHMLYNFLWNIRKAKSTRQNKDYGYLELGIGMVVTTKEQKGSL